MPKNFIIAIDGYSSCGKSTIAKALAKRLNFIYVDSGAMYRAATLYFLRNNIDCNNRDAIIEALENIHVELHLEDDYTQVLLNNEDVSEEIRLMPVSQNVSKVSAIKEVRQAMVKLQQKMGKTKNIVMDGRDIGTTVFPDAQLKVFMTAEPLIRAERRYKELKAKGDEVTVREVLDNLKERDLLDTTRQESPLRKADDAVILDNSHMNPEQQLEFVVNLYKNKIS
ncbi:(d)CMP kinase [Solitalea canadensis]|uniref:Cytidylate kinase n=1 Tax=Solitalea canadensis (strain ATCC 29591 / DSM 3403 / JCM 21819 / LMG 8368 / NBRC 15130 / NCIMB 12057 / USAM 9D) TaxID=929556 RepID=H8KPA7_SOLCM|nr:(d)CMP kinase [Solitalea canadensis]AFD05805.1 cytidylate kinase [Solitalea canadensis DSM 3403]